MALYPVTCPAVSKTPAKALHFKAAQVLLALGAPPSSHGGVCEGVQGLKIVSLRRQTRMTRRKLRKLPLKRQTQRKCMRKRP